MKYLIFCFTLLLAGCNKEQTKTDLTKAPPPPSTQNYFKLVHKVDKSGMSVWELTLISDKPGILINKNIFGSYIHYSEMKMDSGILLYEFSHVHLGDTIYFTRHLETDPNPLNRYDFYRRDQIIVIQKYIDQ